MASILSFLAWNVENFHNDPTRVDRVVDLIAQHDPDIFGLFEVKGAAVFRALTTKMPGYSFFITESPGVPEILVGTRNTISAFVTQKDELQSKVPTLRPGALATVQVNGETYSLLFLHLKSFANPRDWGLRDDMFSHVASLKRAIDRAVDEDYANFVAIGDINTMGLSAAYNNVTDMSGADELSFVDKRMAANHTKLRRLTKTHHETWWNGKDNWAPSSLDHVYASDHLAFKAFEAAEIKVTGWVDEQTVSARKNWINTFSDHCVLYGEIED